MTIQDGPADGSRAAVKLDEPKTSDAYALLGLPFDAVSRREAAELLRARARAGERCFFSTVNVNFLVAAQSAPAFRRSVLESDLVLVDGQPLVWLARLLGLPLPERVAGSDLFEDLQRLPGPPLKVAFFGGPPGAAEEASAQLARRHAEGLSPGLTGVGGFAAGFGDVESLSDETTLAALNASGADFLVVALGAVKGQAWAMRNRDRVQAPLISHLGAVVNFTAGRLDRAPVWARSLGLEWLWRIATERGIWRRYLHDGGGLLRLLLGRVLPQWLFGARPAAGREQAPAQLRVSGHSYQLSGEGGPALRQALAAQPAGDKSASWDLRELRSLDAATAAMLLRRPDRPRVAADIQAPCAWRARLQLKLSGLLD